MDIAPGTNVNVQIVAAPQKEAARKTLIRICSKDRKAVSTHRRQKLRRPSLQSWQRGGRMWEHRMQTKPAVTLAPGATYAIRATVDVLRDLASVKRWVKVSAR